MQLAGGGADFYVSVKEADGAEPLIRCLMQQCQMPQPGVSNMILRRGRSHIEGASKQS
ncbi:hypothetical protein ACNKHT_13655 [Shigella flexneri]